MVKAIAMAALGEFRDEQAEPRPTDSSLIDDFGSNEN
jgi:hypothetical protein